MRIATKPKRLAFVQESEAGGALTDAHALPPVDQRSELAPSKTKRDRPAIFAREVDAWARHALAASGFGDATPAELPASYELMQRARRCRAVMFGAFFAAAIQGAGAIARRVYARRRQRGEARTTYDTLQQLDDRELRDLGLDRSELASIAAEVTGAVESTRTRAQRMLVRP
ncbi:MAG TPA: DUF1127 domain-containing protein [Casimicrobiaceae bacterium]|nr:DUF1127 domain-containing protein [Casimicrobiaceae bacterium]